MKLFHFCGLFRKDQNLLSPVNCWYLLLNQVRRESKDHATLSDIYLNNVIMRFMQISEDSTRLLKKVREDHIMILDILLNTSTHSLCDIVVVTVVSVIKQYVALGVLILFCEI